ncbi:hypothetical protein K439DRAFT_994383 [Ramaria rubella]|nr:hypothetical protein K439DRAFT_994383 [Ramaria rubella]
MSRGSPRRSFSPIRPMSQSYGDRRRSNSYILHPHDRSYVPNEGTRNTESQNFRSTREENVPQRPHSPIDLRRMRLPVPALPYRDRPLTPGPMISFGDRDVTPGIAAPPFRDIGVTSEVVTSSGAAAFQENSSASYMSDDRPLGNDHWSPPAQTTASSVAWDHKVPWSDHRSWPSRSNVSPLYTSNRPLVNSTQRPLLEPSQAWRRAREERDRQLSIEYRTIIPSDRRNSPTDNCVGFSIS